MNGKNRQELIMRNKCYRSFRSQANFLNKNWEELYGRVFEWYFSNYWMKSFLNLDDFWTQMWIYDMIKNVSYNVKRVLNMWQQVSYRLFSKPFAELDIEFDLQNQYAVEYMRKFNALHLSDNPVSISETTKSNVIAILREWVDNNLSYTEVAKKINALDSTTFSLNRAKLIAVRETWQAYEYGNRVPMKQLHDQGMTVEKRWLTVWDDRVTEECRSNQWQWWVDFTYVYFNDWDNIAPRSGNPRCRCTTLYRVWN